MPHTYSVSIGGHDYEINSDKELSDVEAYGYAKQQHDSETPASEWAQHLVANTSGNPLKMIAGDTADAMAHAAKGYATGMYGVVRHPFDTTRNILTGAGQQLGSAVSGLYGAATSLPADTASKIASGFTEGIPNAYNAIVNKASTDPEGYGKDVGRMTGETMAGIAAGSTGRFLPKTAARTLGAGFESVGGKGGTLAFRIGGLGQLANGNPAGIATLLLPEVFRKTGQAMQRWGTEPGALASTPEGMFLQVQQDLRKAGSDPAVADALSKQLDSLAKQAETLRASAKLPSDMAIAQKMTDRVDKLTAALARTTGPAKSAAAAEAENAANLERIAKARMGRIPTDPNLRETVSATDPTGAKQTMSRSFVEPEETGKPTTPLVSDAEVAQIKRRFTNPAAQSQALADLAAQRAGTAPAAQPAVRPPVRIVGGPMQPPPEAAGATPAPTGPVTPPAPPVAPEPNVAPIRVAADKVATNARELATKSKRGIPSGTPGYTVNDLESVGLNPKLNYKALTQDIIDKILENRAARQETYRINEGLNTGGTNAAAREPMTLQEQLEASLRARQGEQ